jgi:pimeloyl-ACP methyl ester carboxylesterase
MVDALVAYSATGFTPEEIASIEVPALIMASGEDRFIPPQVIQTESQYWPNSTYHFFEKSGHFPQREMPETYNSVVLDFLQSLTGARTLI